MDRSNELPTPDSRRPRVADGHRRMSGVGSWELIRRVLVVCALLAGARLDLVAQHETAQDLLDGQRAYSERCATCHGPNGDLIPNIDFSRGQFRRPMADADLVRIIRQGIPNTPMPATNVTEAQASQIVAYLRSLAAGKSAAVIAGDAVRGKTVFDTKGNCTSCHSVAGIGAHKAPDLANVGGLRRTPELERSLLEPQADVQPNHRHYRVVLQDGTTVTGWLLGYDTFNIRMLDSREELRSFAKSDLKSHGFTESPMPSYRNTLTPQEIADIVSYLSTLRTSPAPAGGPRR
jgi:putative heme-binding domain-containing protein